MKLRDLLGFSLGFVKKLSVDHGVVVEYIGQTKDAVIEIKENSKISIEELKNNHEKWFPDFTK